MSEDIELKLCDYTNEIHAFEIELQRLKNTVSNFSKSIGTKEEMDYIQNNANLLANVRKILAYMQQHNCKVEDLKCTCRENFMMIGQAHTQNRWNDLNYIKTLQERLLNPLLAKQMKNMKKLEQYIASEVKKLEDEAKESWIEHFQVSHQLQKSIIQETSSEDNFNDKKICSEHPSHTIRDEVNKNRSCVKTKTYSGTLLKERQIFKPHEQQSNDALSIKMQNNQNFGHLSKFKNLAKQSPSNSFEKVKDNKLNDTIESDSVRNKISAIREFQANYSNFLQEANIFEVVKEYREEIHKITEKRIGELEKHLEIVIHNSQRVHNKEKVVLEKHMNIIIDQQKTFQKYLADVKSQFMDMFNEPIISAVDKCENLFEDVKKECLLLDRFFPLYAFKREVVSLVEKNQVSIILADALYAASEAIPIFIRDWLNDGKTAAVCEPNAIVANYTYQNYLELTNSSFKDESINCGTSQLNTKSMKLVFVTAEELFSLCLSDELFTLYSFIIIRCTLKRSLETELLLHALRECCKQRNDFKLILLVSPPQNISKLNNYFSSVAKTASFFTPHLLYPVHTVWKKGPSSENYIHEVVETVLSIHAITEIRDILVFLPTSDDVAKVSVDLQSKFQEYNFFDVDCVSVTEDFINESISNFLNHRSYQKRKVFLTTSLGECLLFPSVAYVVDSGLVMECNYDSEKSLEVQKLALISRERAKLRKSCAGRYRSGTCFRLFNKNNYIRAMANHECSEMSNKNPFETLLKMYQYKSKDAEQIELIEPLAEDIKESAISLLETANAVKNGELTPLGEHVILLPFPPKYSKMIVLGIQWGFPFEAILLVAFFMAKRPVFLQDIDTQEQKNVAMRKLHFLCQDSDTLTYLNVYKSWMHHNFNEEWCQKNFLDFLSLKEVKNIVSYITGIVSQRFKQSIVPVIHAKEQADWNALQEIVFDCLRSNLSVYSGHSRSGYHLHNLQSMVFLDPYSPVLQKGNLPQFIVFNNLVHSSRNFMSHVTAIPEEVVFAAVDKGILPAETLDAFQVKLVPYVIGPFGISLIKELFQGQKSRRLFSIEEEIKNEIKSDLLVLEPSEESGNVTVYTLPENKQKTVTVVERILEQESEINIQEQENKSMELRKGKSRVWITITWAKGASVIEVDPSSINYATATSAVKTFDDENHFAVKKCINLSWFRRLCTGSGYVSFDSSEFKVARRLSLRTIQVKGHEVIVKISESAENQLVVTGLLPAATADDLKEIVQRVLPNYVSIKDVVLSREKPFQTTNTDLEICMEKLDSLCVGLRSEHLVQDFEIIIPKPVDSEEIMTATIKVDASTEIEDVANQISAMFPMDEIPVKAEPLYSAVFVCTIEIFNAVQQQLMHQLGTIENIFKKAKSCANNSWFTFKVDTHDHDSVSINFSSKAEYVMNYLYKMVQDLLEGVVLGCEIIEGLHKLFTHGGHLWLRALEKEENVYVMEEYKSKTIRIYGLSTLCTQATRRIKEFIMDTKNEMATLVDLSSSKYNSSLFKAVVDKYGFTLESLVEEFNLRSAEINIRTSKLLLHGSPKSIESAMVALENLDASLLSEEEEPVSFQEPCSVCHMPPRQLSLRLEYCGHLYCAECLQGLIKSSQFPIRCCAKSCEKELILEDIRKGLDYGEDAINNLLSLSLNHYLAQNAQRYMYCPAPDCPMFCDKSKMATDKWHCPLCQNDICIKCNVIYHLGYTCEVYEGSKTDENYAYKAWLRDYNANSKLCPQCGCGIEKGEGCNHMSCANCKCHFCWLCATAFPTSQAVYDHIPYCTRNQNPY